MSRNLTIIHTDRTGTSAEATLAPPQGKMSASTGKGTTHGLSVIALLVLFAAPFAACDPKVDTGNAIAFDGARAS